MKKIINKGLRQEIIDAYFGYFDAYAMRDWDTMVAFFDPHLTMVGTGVDEITHEGEKTLANLKREFSQSPMPIKYEVKSVEVFSITSGVALLMITMDVCLHNQHEIVECPNNRTSAVLAKSPDGWKLVHGHWSQPDRDIDVGESVPYRLLRQRSRELEEKVADRTREIEAQKERLEKLNRTKNKLFSVIGHDLRTPFNSLLGFSRMLVEDMDSFSREEVSDIIRTINKQAGMAYGLLDNLLHWAKSQDDKIYFRPEKTQLHTLVADVLCFLRVIADEKGVSFVNEVPGDLHVFADKLMLDLVLRNLVHNAIKFSQSGEKVTISVLPEDRCVRISVADKGVGMDAHLIRELQSCDYAGSMQGTANEQGTGLGLVLTREFITRHGSPLDIQSKPGKGSRFSFLLPVAEGEMVGGSKK